MNSEKKNNRLIWIVSIVIPVAVAALFGIKVEGFDTSFLPPIYATVNGITACLLALALMLVKAKKFKAHEWTMKTAILMSIAFLLMYVVYHMTSSTTYYGDTNGDGTVDEAEAALVSSSVGIYRIILLSHILLSIVVIPLVLNTFLRGVQGKFSVHRKWAKWAFPIWLYVAVTGVVVYYMISPYYA